MSLLRAIASGVLFLLQKRRQGEWEEELRGFLESAVQEKMKQGMSLKEASRAVRLERGSLDGAKEQVRAAGWESFVETSWRDLRFALRTLRKSPGLTAVALLTLALGIGAPTAIFSAVNPILFEPLPCANPVWGLFQGARSQVTFFNYRELLERNHSFEALAIFEPWQPAMIGGTEPQRLEGQSVSYGYFRALGIEPAIARDFESFDDIYGSPHVVIVSYGLWQRRFGETVRWLARKSHWTATLTQ
jgi:putative ABC transport system permease protein